jgi:hypothetical protein
MTQKSAVLLFICWLFKDYEISAIPIYCSKFRRTVKYGEGRAGRKRAGIMLGCLDNYIGITEENHDKSV